VHIVLSVWGRGGGALGGGGGYPQTYSYTHGPGPLGGPPSLGPLNPAERGAAAAYTLPWP